MFSDVLCKVTLNGTPIKDASIERYYRWAWDEKKESNNTTTNEDSFKLPAEEKMSLLQA